MDVRLHGASPWVSKRIVVLLVVAADVSYHGARPWHRSWIARCSEAYRTFVLVRSRVNARL